MNSNRCPLIECAVAGDKKKKKKKKSEETWTQTQKLDPNPAYSVVQNSGFMINNEYDINFSL